MDADTVVPLCAPRRRRERTASPLGANPVARAQNSGHWWYPEGEHSWGTRGSRGTGALGRARGPTAGEDGMAVIERISSDGEDAERLWEEITTLQQAVLSRDVIGQAKGILMERFRISADDAFGMLSKLSQDRNEKVRSIA